MGVRDGASRRQGQGLGSVALSMASVAAVILNELREGWGLHIEEAQAGTQWVIVGVARTGETWIIHHDDRYRAACALAQMLGVDLDG